MSEHPKAGYLEIAERLGITPTVKPVVAAAVQAIVAFAPNLVHTVTREQAEGVLRLWGRVHELTGVDVAAVLCHFTAEPAIDPDEQARRNADAQCPRCGARGSAEVLLLDDRGGVLRRPLCWRCQDETCAQVITNLDDLGELRDGGAR